MSYREEQRAMIRAILNGNSNVSVVPQKVDYRNDPAMCLTTVALLPRDLAQTIETQLILPLKALEPDHFYYDLEEMHLTVKGVQVIADPPTFTRADIEAVDRVMAERIPRHRPIAFQLEQVATFTTSLALTATSEADFGELVRDLDAGLKEVGVPDNKCYISDYIFFGSISFCRFRHAPSSHFLDSARDLKLTINNFLVESVSLISCNAVCAVSSRKIWNQYFFSK
jgi:hypothetical protein